MKKISSNFRFFNPKLFRRIQQILHLFYKFFQIFWTAHSKSDLKTRSRLVLQHVKDALKGLGSIPVIAKEWGNVDSPALKDLEMRVRGLHSLLPNSELYSYSILIPIYQPSPSFLKQTLQSALSQSAPHFEVLLGLDGPQSPEVMEVIAAFSSSEKANAHRIRVIPCERARTGGGISQTTNQLAESAKGRFLFLMDHDDWIAPDLLYRYEQCLRLYQNPEQIVLYCDEYKINVQGEAIFGSHTSKPEHPSFPYLFINWICHGLLVPKTAWEKVCGLRTECDGAQDFDLCLRLDAAGFAFQLVPFFLYAWRVHPQSTAFSLDVKDYATSAGIRALQDYCRQKNLNWEISQGYLKTTYRAIPQITFNENQRAGAVQVVIPFHDQKEKTLQAVESVKQQTGVDVFITAVDNQSQDLSIGKTLLEMDVEVLRIEEPFNYSRLNNIATRQTQYLNQTDSLLFLNNDVTLNPGALLEMYRWIHQPKVGLVGARLYYGNGMLQHGGIQLNLEKRGGRTLRWEHVDYRAWPHQVGISQVIRVCDAVTAAALLVRRKVFEEVGGFDEIWYPIAFSDTDLAVKISRLGYFPLYTPYATGTHDESLSRGPGVYEQPECSYWLLSATRNRNVPQVQLPHSLLGPQTGFFENAPSAHPREGMQALQKIPESWVQEAILPQDQL